VTDVSGSSSRTVLFKITRQQATQIFAKLLAIVALHEADIDVVATSYARVHKTLTSDAQVVWVIGLGRFIPAEATTLIVFHCSPPPKWMGRESQKMQIDSSFRDRSAWPNPANFQVGVRTSAVGGDGLSFDDPSSAMSYSYNWTGNLFDQSIVGSNQVACTISAFTGLGSLTGQKTQAFQYGIELIVTANNLGAFNTTPNYYRGATATIGTARRSVYSSESVSANQMRLRLKGPALLSDPSSGSAVVISDPTDASLGQWFVPAGPSNSNAFSGSQVLFNETRRQKATILGYDGDDALVSVGPLPGWSNTDNVGICQVAPEVFEAAPGASTKYISLVGATSGVTNYYVGDWLYVPTTTVYTNGQERGSAVRIIQYSVGQSLVIVSPELPVAPLAGDLLLIWRVCHDNYTPLFNTGFLSAAKKDPREICYEVSPIWLALPNVLLNSGQGGKIAQSNYVFLELKTLPVSDSTQVVLCTNNKHGSQTAMFCLKVPNITREESADFVCLTGDQFSARLQWKPNCGGIGVCVRFGNGQIFQTAEPDSVAPYRPKPHLQISLLLSFRNIATGMEDRKFLLA